MSNIMLSVKELFAGYDKKTVISDMSFEVRSGEILSLIGPNGAGKSTVLKVIAKYLEKQKGFVYIDNTEQESISRAELAKKLSVTLTERIRPELMTCREVVETGRYPYTGAFGRLNEQDKRAVEQAMEETATLELADELFNRVSDGQRQRVILAKAICQQPQILALDEPTSYLDIRHKIAFFETLHRLAKQRGIAVIISMHEIELARIISDKVVCIKNGEVTDSGTPEEIFTPQKIMRLYDIPEELYKKYFE